jgi:hypothetical protein
MTMNRRSAIVAGGCAVLSSAFLSPVESRADASTVPVVGRKARWVSILPDDGWMGGTVNQIKDRLAFIKENKNLDEVDRMMFGGVIERLVPLAEACDVYFVNIKDGVTKSEMVTTLRTDIFSSDTKANFSDEEFRSSFAKKLAESMVGAPGARVSDTPLPESLKGRIDFAKEAKVGGRQALSIELRADLKNGSAFYDVQNFVALTDGRWQSVWLTVDSEHFSDRLNDLGRMLRAVRYLT